MLDAVNDNIPLIVVVPEPSEIVLLTPVLGFVNVRLLKVIPELMLLIELLSKLTLTKPELALNKPDDIERIVVEGFSIVNSPDVEVKFPPFITTAPFTNICPTIPPSKKPDVLVIDQKE